MDTITKTQEIDTPVSSDVIAQKIKKSLIYSIIDGTFWAMMVGCGESFFSAFAVLMCANTIQLGILGSLPQVLGSVSQFFTNRLVNLFRSRQRFICLAVLVQAFMYIPIALSFFLGSNRVDCFLAFASCYWISGMIFGPAWNSWMGDLVAPNERGRYFGTRNRIMSTSSLLTMLSAGMVLNYFSHDAHSPYLGFAILFSLACLARLISGFFLSKKYEPPFQNVSSAEFGFVAFIREARQSQYGIFIVFMCLLNFSVYLSAPFFAPYMLVDLKLDYLSYTIINVTPVIVKIWLMPRWGRICDEFGTIKVLTFTGYWVPFVPLMWLFGSDFWYLVFSQIICGVIWSGFELASFNFVFEATKPALRVSCIAYYNIINGAAILLGGICGSMVVKYNQCFWSQYLLVILLSGICRYVIGFIFLPRLKELRSVEPISYGKMILTVVTALPKLGIIHEIMTFRKKNGKMPKA